MGTSVLSGISVVKCLYRASSADFYLATARRPVRVFVDNPVHLGKTRTAKDEELRTLLRKKGYRVLELYYDDYTDKKKDELYAEMLYNLGINQRRDSRNY